MKSSVKFPVGQWPKFLSPDEEQVHGCIFITGFLSPGEEEGDVSCLYEGGADAVSQTGQLLQAVCM